MNCKPGDRALLVKPFRTSDPECGKSLVGKLIIKVTSIVGFSSADGAEWGIEGDPIPCPKNCGGPCQFAHFPDGCLSPLPPESDVDKFDAQHKIDTPIAPPVPVEA